MPLSVVEGVGREEMGGSTNGEVEKIHAENIVKVAI